MSQDKIVEGPRTPPPTEFSLKEFFETVPPGRPVIVKVRVSASTSGGGGTYYSLSLPPLDLHCDADSCNGYRIFESKKDITVQPGTESDHVIDFECRNCQDALKTYAVRIAPEKGSSFRGTFTKFGELPQFGAPTPSRVISILGPEKEYYLKGRRAENQGMGIAAFAYYRRVVENQKNRLLDEIIRVAQKIGGSAEMLVDLNEAKSEVQFSTAVGAVKHGIPSGLLIDGHNPLTLLHTALSEGLHAKTDEECLALATSIRVVLADLADRLGHALKGRAELDAAVSRLMK